MFKLGTMQKAFVAWLKQNADKQITGRLGYVCKDEKGEDYCAVCVLGALLIVKGASSLNYTLSDTLDFVRLADRSNSGSMSEVDLRYSWQELGLYSESGSMHKGIKINGAYYSSLVSLNDEAKLTFRKIAELIEVNPHNFFFKSV